MIVAVINPALEQFVAQYPIVQALPENSTQIIRICNDPDSSLARLQKIISQDAALASRLLKAVNSAFYSLPEKIARLDRAIAFMGLRAVKELTVSTCVGAICKPTSLGKYDARDLWDHSIGVAIAARELAIQSRRMDPEEAFLAGMLHDIGLLLMVQSVPKSAEEILGAVVRDGSGFLNLETKVFGFHHCELGEYLATAWKFPEQIATGIRWHQDPLNAPSDQQTIASFLYVADMLCAKADIGCPLTCSGQALGSEHLDAIGIKPEAADALAAKLKILLRLFL